jgi:hypothetical protein
MSPALLNAKGVPLKWEESEAHRIRHLVDMRTNAVRKTFVVVGLREVSM